MRRSLWQASPVNPSSSGEFLLCIQTSNTTTTSCKNKNWKSLKGQEKRRQNPSRSNFPKSPKKSCNSVIPNHYSTVTKKSCAAKKHRLFASKSKNYYNSNYVTLNNSTLPSNQTCSLLKRQCQGEALMSKKHRKRESLKTSSTPSLPGRCGNKSIWVRLLKKDVQLNKTSVHIDLWLTKLTNCR